MLSDRHATIGDMIIYRRRETTHIGIVTESLKVGGTPSVLISWCGDMPRAYDTRYGYAVVNIHNNYTDFEVIKAK